MKRYKPLFSKAICTCVALGVIFVSVHVGIRNAECQATQDAMMQKQEEARRLEREIGDLESRMSKVKRDWVTVSAKLEELEQNILNCYMEIDEVQTEIEKSRGSINGLIRSLYVDGRMSDLEILMSSKDISEFVTNYDRVARVVSEESLALNKLRKRRNRLELYRERLTVYRREQARLARGTSPDNIEAAIEGKRKSLTELNAEIVSMQQPVTLSQAPVDFNPERVYSMPEGAGFTSTGQILSGYSSWYGNEFHGRPTASGEIYDQNSFTCAHRTLPFGTWLRVTFHGRSVIVRVNDRGPFVKGRMLDLSRGSAEEIGLTGVQWVDCEILVPRKS